MIFPINKKKIIINPYANVKVKNLTFETEIPVHFHPGSFAFQRKNHIHEGVDIYCMNDEPVYCMEDSKVINILPFTGEIANSPWWNNTFCVLLEGESGVINYGEILPYKSIKVGDKLKEGDFIGTVERVLKKDKGRPRDMLHVELYVHGTSKHIHLWNLNMKKPTHLLDPTNLLLKFAND